MAKKAEPKEEQMSKLDQFFDDLGNRSPSTIAGYKSAIWQFMHYIYPDAEKNRCAEYVEQYFREPRNFHADFKKFIKDTLGDKPGLSARQVFNQIKNFFALCDVSFSVKEISQLKNQLPGGKTLTQESDMDTETIRAILQHTDVKGKAIILCLASGGMRIGELLQVQCSDVDLKSIPAVIQIRARTAHGKTKTLVQRYTFISSEAVSAVKEWIKIRPEHLQMSAKKSANLNNAPVDVNDGRLFPLSDNSVNQLFKDAVTAVFGKNETDPNTGRSTHHVHQLRKFFSSQISLVTSEAVADFFFGHKTALSDNYRRYTIKQMSEYYLKGEHLLYIEAPAELREAASTTKKEIASMKDDTLKNHSVLLSLMNEKDRLKDTVKAQEEQIKLQTEQIAKMQEMYIDLNSKLTVISMKLEDLPDSIGVKE